MFTEHAISLTQLLFEPISLIQCTKLGDKKTCPARPEFFESRNGLIFILQCEAFGMRPEEEVRRVIGSLKPELVTPAISAGNNQ